MKNLLTASILIASVLGGAGLALNDDLRASASNMFPEQNNLEDNHTDHSHESSGDFEFGTTHEHALFYMVVNGSELSFLDKQLEEDYVHLENNNSNIVHKHATGVTWKDFLTSIDVTVSQGEKLCVNAKNISQCGNGTVWLNGERSASIEAEISQGDRMFIILGDSFNQTLSDYYSEQLPRAYSPEASRGRRL
ncbi:hypothetical protein [Candidatus Nanohalococcus occultus]|uniref:Uncharacterized protein n=1 Tax=Candidatus Nanohalococcus occultus TaxID=2978047 RepID=A0ABY8CF67_9ARCH|nr:Uncharacterized protein SVXNc_0330 [Candidatus Nanohaloarchaeota archaeon SVXNc]